MNTDILQLQSDYLEACHETMEATTFAKLLRKKSERPVTVPALRWNF